MDAPRIHYAQAEGASIAYQSFGQGPRTFVLIPPFAHNIELIWQRPEAAEFLRRLAALGRVIQFDKRGCGRSDRRLPPPSLEQRTADLQAVLDTEQVEQAVLFGNSEGGTLATFFAASFPERSDALVLKGAYASLIRSEDQPWMRTERMWKVVNRLLRPAWGTGFFYRRYMAPTNRADGFNRWARQFELGSIAKTHVRGWAERNQMLDIRAVLGTVQAPTLVLHASKDPIVPIACGHYLAEKIPGAQFVELPGKDHVPFFSAGTDVLNALEDFVERDRGTVPTRGRSLATILFTDIVGSTQLANEVGDQHWIELLDRHDAITREGVSSVGGRWIKSTGDGALATFTNPSQAIRCALAIGERVGAECGFEIRSGIHTAEVELRDGDVGGIGVHEAARVQAEAGPSEVLVSLTTRKLVNGNDLLFESRGSTELKGIPGANELFRVVI